LAAWRAEGGRIVLVHAVSGFRSERRMNEEAERRALATRERLELTTGRTFSMAVSFGIRSRQEVSRKWAKAIRLLSMSVFFGPRHTFRLDDPNVSAEPVCPFDAKTGAEAMMRALETGRIDEIRKTAFTQFERVETSRDIAGLADFCRQLFAVVSQRLEGEPLPSLTAWRERDSFDRAWSTVAGIRDWFLERFAEIAGRDQALSSRSRKVREALAYLYEHFADPNLNADQVAAHVGISRDHLRHVFKEETGQTVLDKLTEIRMEHAKRLLAEGRYKVYEIAARVGFRDSRYFSQVFRKETGVNPVEYMEGKR
jgi:two-component system response regulator YesN